MRVESPSTGSRAGFTAIVRSRIEQGGERLWRLEDFADLPFAVVAQALSRLVRAHYLERYSKGTYYRARQTAFGKSKPNPAAIEKLGRSRKTVFPAGIAAASLLGLTTQMAKRAEIATSATSLPRKLFGRETVIHTRRPEAWAGLTQVDAAFLDVLRRHGRTSELPPAETVQRLQSLLKEGRRLERLLRVASSEPPRVRAMLGALAERAGRKSKELAPLRTSLNPLSRFDFGLLSVLPNAKMWQAKEQTL